VRALNGAQLRLQVLAEFCDGTAQVLRCNTIRCIVLRCVASRRHVPYRVASCCPGFELTLLLRQVLFCTLSGAVVARKTVAELLPDAFTPASLA
jgi:hypothetical protein